MNAINVIIIASSRASSWLNDVRDGPASKDVLVLCVFVDDVPLTLYRVRLVQRKFS